MSSKNMKEIIVEKIVLHVSTSPEPNEVKKAIALLKAISGVKPISTRAKKRIAEWKVRPGVPIGAKVTIRGKKANVLLMRLLHATEFNLNKKQFTQNGFAFGIKEYIDIEDMKYDPKLGMIGLEVCVTLARPGFRIKQRSLHKKRIGGKHAITKEDAIQYASKTLKIEVIE